MYTQHSEYGKENEKEKDKEKEFSLYERERESFSSPSVNDVIVYAREAGLEHVDAQLFVDYYASVGWVCGNKPMRDWKATVRLWDMRARKELDTAPKAAEEVWYGEVL